MTKQEYLREWDRKQRATNPDYVERRRASVRKWRENYPDRAKAADRAKRNNNRGTYRKNARDYAKRLKLRLRKLFFEMYGSRCKCCKESNNGFLTLDHVKGDGAKSRAGRSNVYEYKSATKKFRPSMYQVLCFNCNCGRARNGGICPHKEKSP